MAKENSRNKGVQILSFLEPNEEKEILNELNLDQSNLMRGQDCLASHQPEKIRRKVVVLMPNRADVVARNLMKVIRITRKRQALVFFEDLPHIDLGQAMHFDEILVWPCQDQLRNLLDLPEAVETAH